MSLPKTDDEDSKKSDPQQSDICRHQCVKMHGSAKVGSRWQIVIPKDIRDTLKIAPDDTLLIFTKHDTMVWLIKADDLEHFIEYIKSEMNQ